MPYDIYLFIFTLGALYTSSECFNWHIFDRENIIDHLSHSLAAWQRIFKNNFLCLMKWKINWNESKQNAFLMELKENERRQITV